MLLVTLPLLWGSEPLRGYPQSQLEPVVMLGPGPHYTGWIVWSLDAERVTPLWDPLAPRGSVAAQHPGSADFWEAICMAQL